MPMNNVKAKLDINQKYSINLQYVPKKFVGFANIHFFTVVVKINV